MSAILAAVIIFLVFLVIAVWTIKVFFSEGSWYNW